MVGDLELARRCINKAIKTNPNHYYVMAFAAAVLAWLGEVEEALRWRELYIRHDPLSAASAAEMDFEVYFLAERYEDAITTIERWHSLPSHILAGAAATYAQAGRLEEAQALRERYENSLPPGSTIDDHVAAVLRTCAQQKHRDQWLEGFRIAGFAV